MRWFVRLLCLILALALAGVALAARLPDGQAPAPTESVPAAESSPPDESRLVPYPIHKKTLPNGLDVVVIEMPEFRDVLSYNTMVLAGARNETEPGKTGLAHLFEHILFRHRYGGEDGGYEKAMNALGAYNNAWTWFDVTFYHPLTFTSNLLSHDTDAGHEPGVIELESARFSSLDISKKIFQTEAGAVLGEYRRNASFPSLKMDEHALALLFPHHPYGHTTLGFYPDVVDMPQHYDAAMEFYKTYYRPNNCLLIVAGDVKAEEVFADVEPYYRDWQSRPVPTIEATGETPQKEQREQVSWDADVAPLVWVAYRTPAFHPGTTESAVAELLSSLLVEPAAPLYQKLRYQKQSVSDLELEEGTQGFESFDPRLLVASARLYKDKYAQRGKKYSDEVAADVITGFDDLKRFSRQKDARKLLEVLKSRYRYDFLAELSSPGNVAERFAWYYRFDRDPDVFEKLLHSVEQLTPKDIDAFAQTYFVPQRRAVLTLTYQPAAAGGAAKEGAER